MPQPADTTRRFIVQARHVDSHHARFVDEASFESAAVAYVEDFSPPAKGEDHGISVIVRDLGTGHERCFRIDLESGETAPCA